MLHSIHIRNWKGHSDLPLKFQKGVNFIIGPNGIGKTSILDAICFAFLGSIDFTGSYYGISYKNLIRDTTKSSEITLSFSFPDENQYVVERSVDGRKKAILRHNSQTIATQWDEVTAKVLDIYNISPLFFGRFVALSEGDTYEYINKPPGQGLANHIENILGIKRMDYLETILTKLNKKYRDSSRDFRREIRDRAVLSEKDTKLLQELIKETGSLEKELKSISEDMRQIQKKRNVLVSESNTLEKSLGEISSISNDYPQEFQLISTRKDPRKSIQKLINQIDSEYNDINSEKNQITRDIGKLSALIDYQQSVIDIVQPLMDKLPREKVCPVCKRPLTEHMMEQIGRECSETILSLKTDLEGLNLRQDKLDDSLNLNRQKFNSLVALDSRIAHLIEYDSGTISTNEIRRRIKSINTEDTQQLHSIEELEKKESAQKARLLEINMEKERIQQKIDQQNILRLEREATSSTKVEFLTEALRLAIRDSFTEQRRIMLVPLTEELSKMWSRFLNRSVKVEMGDNFELRIFDEHYNKPFEFPQLSGGEKTALLILTQLLLCNQFSDCDFMLIDEPLEHLDLNNRWALVNFLVQSCKVGFPKQLIITTIEQSYIREYLNDPTVQVLSLG